MLIWALNFNLRSQSLVLIRMHSGPSTLFCHTRFDRSGALGCWVQVIRLEVMLVFDIDF
jgi:hypothetical protein